MAFKIGNTTLYSRKEVQRATLFSKNTVIGLFKSGEIKNRKNDQGAYQVDHDDLADYLVDEQNIPPHLVDKIIKWRVSDSKTEPKAVTN